MFNQNRIDPTCLLCKEGDETVEHFLLNCTALSSARQPIIDNITDTRASLPTNDPDRLPQLILDSSDLHLLETIEFHSRRCTARDIRDCRLSLIEPELETKKKKKKKKKKNLKSSEVIQATK